MKSIKTLASESVILSAMSALADKIAGAAKRSVIGSILTGYDDFNGKGSDSLICGALSAPFKGSDRVRNARRACIGSFEKSGIIGFFNRLINEMLGSRIRQFGVFLLVFGFVSTAVYIANILLGGENDISVPVTSAGILICAAVALTSPERLNVLLCSGRISSTLLFGLFGARRESFEKTVPHDGRYSVAVALGLLLGGATYFVHPILISAAFIAVLVLYAILCIPENGVVMIIFTLPFLGMVPHPSLISAAVVLYTVFCTFLKVIRGKRRLDFELSDGAVLVFFLLTLLGGFFSASRSDSMSYTLIYCCLMLSYFLVVILIRTSAWIKRCVGALLTSCTLVSLYGIYQNYLGTASTKWQDTEMFSEMGGRITSTFENPNVLAEYLIMCIPFAAALFFIRKGWGKKAFAAGIAAVCFAALIFTMSRGAWLGFMIGILVFLLIYSRKTLVLCCFGLLGIPFLPFVLPQSIIKRFTSIGDVADSSTAYRVHIWEGCVRLIRDFFAGGIGVGKGVFSLVYPSYTLAGIESAPHAHNLYLQIIIELGIFGILAFLFAAVVTAQTGFSLYTCESTDDRAKPYKLFSAAALSGLIAVAAQGMTDYIWYNYRVFLMFWLLAGMVSAIRRSARREYLITDADIEQDLID